MGRSWDFNCGLGANYHNFFRVVFFKEGFYRGTETVIEIYRHFITFLFRYIQSLILDSPSLRKRSPGRYCIMPRVVKQFMPV
jgi:hypothetical protein